MDDLSRSTRARGLRLILAASLAVSAIGGAATTAGAQSIEAGPVEGCTTANTLNAASLTPTDVVSTSQFDEAPATIDSVKLTDEQAEAARAANFQIAIAMQTMDIDWSKLVVQGITDTLTKYGADVVTVTDPNFDPVEQTAQIDNIITLEPDAVISMATDLTATAPAYKRIGEAGIGLILMHMVPQGLTYPDDYQSVISPDNEGNGQVAAQILAEYIPEGGVVGIVDFGIDFFTTNVRTNRFKEWMGENRPDIVLKQVDFIDPSAAGDVAANFMTANPDLNGLFAVWDAPALQVASAMRAQGKSLPITTIDLGNESAIELARCGDIKGLSAQQPYDQGVAEAEAALLSLLGEEVAPWIVLPSVPVLPNNVLEAYPDVWKTDPIPELTAACDESGACQE